MKYNVAANALTNWDRKGRSVFTSSDLRKIFSGDSEKTLSEGLRRLVKKGLLVRVANGVYVFENAQSKGADLILKIAKALRRGFYSYVSLESALSEHGAISQIMTDRVTIMTTGRRGLFKTPFGTIEFVHTQRRPAEILDRTIDVDRPLRLAKPSLAAEDLVRANRNRHLVSEKELRELIVHGN